MPNAGCYRKNLRVGMRVAVVLKEHQPTGTLTYGSIAQILTPSAHHHRGIKVRLKDGRVGRVQQILAAEAPPPPATTMAILAVKDRSGRHYARRFDRSPGDSITALGLDATDQFGRPVEQLIAPLASAVEGAKAEPERVLALDLKVGARPLALYGYLVVADRVNDPQQNDWSWVGWLTEAEVRDLIAAGKLSVESQEIFQIIGASVHR